VCDLMLKLFAIVLSEWRIEAVIELSKCYEIWFMNRVWIDCVWDCMNCAID